MIPPTLAAICRLLLAALFLLISVEVCCAEASDVGGHRRIEQRAPPPIAPPKSDQKPGGEPAPSGHDLHCVPFGTCEPCPADALDEPFCQPFGNRRLLHCINGTEAGSRDPHGRGDENTTPDGKIILAWESCGRISAQERADFFEFVACNIAFTVVALGLVVWRSRVVQARQARILAARIGMVGRGRR